MNKKRFLAVILVLMLSILSACSLVDIPKVQEGNGNTELTFDGDYLVGFLAYVKIGDEYNYSFYPTQDFEDEDAWCFYIKTDFVEYPYGLVPRFSTEFNGNLFEPHSATANNGPVPNGKITVEASFFYTYELINSSLSVEGIYRKNDNTYYTKGSGSSHWLSGMGSASMGLTETMAASRTNIDGTKEEITYEGKVTLNFKMLDYLIGSRILEFDAGHNLLKYTEIDLSLQSEEDFKLQVANNCEYVIIEKDYEVMNETDYSTVKKGTKYTERTLIEKKSQSKSGTLYVPEGNGFVKALWVFVDFSE